MKNKHVRRSLAALLVLAMLLCALPVLPAAAEEVNLTRQDGVTATASNEEVGTNYSFTADNAIDGNTSDRASRWSTLNDGTGTTERTLTVDLGAVRTYRQQTAEHVEVLTKQRDACARALRRKVPPPDAQAKRDELTRQLAELRREIRLCDRVIDRVTRTRTCREQLRLQTQREREQAHRARYRSRER